MKQMLANSSRICLSLSECCTLIGIPRLFNCWVLSGGGVVWWCIVNTLASISSCSTLGPVNTWMGDRKAISVVGTYPAQPPTSTQPSIPPRYTGELFYWETNSPVSKERQPVTLWPKHVSDFIDFDSRIYEHQAYVVQLWHADRPCQRLNAINTYNRA